MSIKKAKQEPGSRKAGRRARAGVVAVGVLAASLLAGATAAEADTVGYKLCQRVSACDGVQPQGVRWQ